MRTRHKTRGQATKGARLLASAVAVFAAATTLAQQTEGPGADSTVEPVLTEVIVTAQRREQRLQDVGLAVTALTGRDVEAMGITNAADIARVVPGLKMNSYSSAAVVYNIRGVSQNDYGDQQEPPVAVYQDDSYASTIVLAGFPVFDLARIETLRGPQGTLFGRNATGGAIQFISNQPTDEFEGYARGTYARFDQVRLEGAISGPLGDTFTARFAGAYSDGGNYYEAVTPGMPDLGGEHNYALRSILKWTPTEDSAAWLTLRYMDARHERAAGLVTHEPTCPNEFLQGEYLPADESCAFFGSPPGAIASGYRNDAINPHRGGDPWKTAHSYPTYVDRELNGAQLHVDVDFGAVALTSISDFQHAEKFYSEDIDGTPDALANYYTALDLDQVSQEVRLAGEAGSVQWVAGGMGMVIDGVYDGAFELPFYNFFPQVDFTQRTKSYAVFGQTEWQVIPTIKLIGGLRYWEDRREARYHAAETASTGVEVFYSRDGFVYLQDGVSQPLPGVTASSADARKSYSGVTARAEIDYKPTDDVLMYLSFNRGSKSGGYTLPTASPFPGAPVDAFFNGARYEPETLSAIEAGVKSTLGSWTTLNVAVFHYDYRDYQAFAQYGVAQTIINVDANVVGLEAELTARPVDGLTLQASTSWLDSKVKDVPLPDGITFTDHDLPQAPAFSAWALARYEFLLGPGGASVQADAQYVSAFCFTVLCAPADNEPSYALANARAGYSIGGIDVEVYVTNITNREYRIYAVDNSAAAGLVYSSYARPRTYGVSIGYKFGASR